MTGSLRPEIVPPSHSYLWGMVGASLGCGVVGAMVVLATTAAPMPGVLVPALPDVRMEESVRMPISVETRRTVAPAPRSSQLRFVFRAGGATYMKLEDLGSAGDPKQLPAHGQVKLVTADDSTAAIAVVRDAEVPEAHRGWKGKQVLVEQSCTATVVGFAVVSRLVGDTGYAGIEDEAWTAASVMGSGKTVLAARLDGCTKGLYARDAALPKIVALEPVANEDLALAARSALLASDAARETQLQWAEAGQEGEWSEHTELDTKVLRHPLTGVTWISVHGNADEGCGGPEVNVWGLFRVERDGSLATVEARKLEDLHRIEQIIDLEGDGELELVGRPWLGLDLVLTRASGEELERLAMPFYGCPC